MEEKLREEFEKIKDLIDETPVEYVMNHLILAGAENPELADKILNSVKTLKGCCKYIYSSVEKSVKGKSGMVCVCESPEEVYALAEEYFLEESIQESVKKEKHLEEDISTRESDPGVTIKSKTAVALKNNCQKEEADMEFEQISFFS